MPSVRFFIASLTAIFPACMRVSVGPFDPLPTYECQYVYGIFSDVKLNSKSKKGYIVVKIWKE